MIRPLSQKSPRDGRVILMSAGLHRTLGTRRLSPGYEIATMDIMKAELQPSDREVLEQIPVRLQHNLRV